MNNTSKRYLLQIEPIHAKSATPVDDTLTRKMKVLLENGERKGRFKGSHKCICGERSGSSNIIVKGYITNSLAVHYLRWHRQDIPATEIRKLRNII